MVGDRYQKDSVILEIIEITKESDVRVVCIEADNMYWRIADIVLTDDTWTGWTYLGNFSKSNRFKEIYDILNS